MAKLFAKIEAFEIYRLPGKVAIFENGEFFVQFFRKGNAAAFRDPEAYVRELLASRVEADADREARRAGFRRLMAEARAKRAEQIARQGAFHF